MDNVLHIGGVTLGTVPRVVGVVDRVYAADELRELGKRGAQLLEVRIDRLEIPTDELRRYLDDVRNLSGLGIIGTIRENERTVGRRLGLFKQILPYVDAIDIEIDADIREQVIELARDKLILVSEHDFDGTPETPRLQELVEQGIAAGAAVVKLAVMAHSAQDSVRLLQFCKHCPHPLVVIGMGDYGMVTRLIAPLFDSLFTYAFVNESVAPGQIELGQMVTDLERYFPLFKAQLQR